MPKTTKTRKNPARWRKKELTGTDRDQLVSRIDSLTLEMRAVEKKHLNRIAEIERRLYHFKQTGELE